MPTEPSAQCQAPHEELSDSRCGVWALGLNWWVLSLTSATCQLCDQEQVTLSMLQFLRL